MPKQLWPFRWETCGLFCGKPVKCSWGNKLTPPGTNSTPLPPPAVGHMPGLSATDLATYERQIALSRMGDAHALMHLQGQHAVKAGMGMGGAGTSYDGGYQDVATTHQLMYYQ